MLRASRGRDRDRPLGNHSSRGFKCRGSTARRSRCNRCSSISVTGGPTLTPAGGSGLTATARPPPMSPPIISDTGNLDPSAFDRASFATVVYGDGVEAVIAKPLKGNPMARRTPRRDSKGRFLKSGKSKSRKGARKSRRSSKRKSSRRGRKHSSSGKTVHVKRGSRVTIVAT